MKKQKVVLGTDDKHVYFKMQNRKQAVRFVKWFVYMCVCNVFEYSERCSISCLRFVLYLFECTAMLALPLYTLPWFCLEFVTFETMQGWNTLVFSTLSCASVKVRHSQVIFFNFQKMCQEGHCDTQFAVFATWQRRNDLFWWAMGMCSENFAITYIFYEAISIDRQQSFSQFGHCPSNVKKP